MDEISNFPVTIALVAINVVVSLLALNNQEMFSKSLMWPYGVKRYNQYYRFITSGFIHADYIHLFFNMFTLYSFGRVIEVYFSMFGLGGTVAYLALYFLGLIASDLPSYLKHRDDYNYHSLGASGAVSAGAGVAAEQRRDLAEAVRHQGSAGAAHRAVLAFDGVHAGPRYARAAPRPTTTIASGQPCARAQAWRRRERAWRERTKKSGDGWGIRRAGSVVSFAEDQQGDPGAGMSRGNGRQQQPWRGLNEMAPRRRACSAALRLRSTARAPR